MSCTARTIIDMILILFVGFTSMFEEHVLEYRQKFEVFVCFCVLATTFM